MAFPWNLRRQMPFKVYRTFEREKTGLLTVKKYQCKRISWQQKHIPYKADTTRR